MTKMAILAVITFFCAFSKIPTKRTFVCLLFLKLNQSRNSKKVLFFLGGGFLQKPKTHFFWGPKWYFLKFKFQICISAFVLYCKRKLHANFQKKNLYLTPWNFFKIKTLTCVLKIRIWTSKIIPDL